MEIIMELCKVKTLGRVDISKEHITLEAGNNITTTISKIE